MAIVAEYSNSVNVTERNRVRQQRPGLTLMRVVAERWYKEGRALFDAGRPRGVCWNEDQLRGYEDAEAEAVIAEKDACGGAEGRYFDHFEAQMQTNAHLLIEIQSLLCKYGYDDLSAEDGAVLDGYPEK